MKLITSNNNKITYIAQFLFSFNNLEQVLLQRQGEATVSHLNYNYIHIITMKEKSTR